MVSRDDFHSSQEAILSENEYLFLKEQLNEFGLSMEKSLLKQEILSEPSPPPPQSPTCALPSIEDWPGPFNFELFVNSISSNKKTWLYSHVLNKIFIDVSKSIPLQFKIHNPNDEEGFSIRALPVYTVGQYLACPVKRCPLHLREDEDKGLANVNHVVRCEDNSARYEFDDDSKRYSVVVSLARPQPGCDLVTHMYSLVCKTSCCGGMNRRPLMLIFTLEKDNQVVGRKTVNFRVCSCPKRDKEKEEKTVMDEKDQNFSVAQGKKLMPEKDIPPLKKRKLFSSAEDCSETTEVFDVKIPGIKHYREVLRYLIMLKYAEYQETGSQEALKVQAGYEEKLRKTY